MERKVSKVKIAKRIRNRFLAVGFVVIGGGGWSSIVCGGSKWMVR